MPSLVQIDRLAAIPAPGRITSLLIKPVSALCNLDCSYCFYLDRETDPYRDWRSRRMSGETLRQLVTGYLAYSHPVSKFTFQGGEPTLAGVEFYEQLCTLQQLSGQPGQVVGNSLQTNGILLNDRWCKMFREFQWLVGLSLDGTRHMHDEYRNYRDGSSSWRKTMRALSLLQKHGVAHNVLCVVSQANVAKPAELYRFFRDLGIEHLQFIPLADFAADGTLTPGSLDAEQYGRFLTEMFDAWWPDRGRIHIRFFDNILEALLNRKPTTCTMHDSCDSYAVVEYNGDVYPCDFFVEESWKLGNIHRDSWMEIAKRQTRAAFAAKKGVSHADCDVCEYASLCQNGCPKQRYMKRGRFEDLDHLCASYKSIFAKAIPSLRAEVAQRVVQNIG